MGIAVQPSMKMELAMIVLKQFLRLREIEDFVEQRARLAQEELR